MQTLLLDVQLWDLVLDTNGDMAIASDPYSVAQDVATACRTFLGEVFYDTTIGVPYIGRILGQQLSIAFLKTQIAAAAATVPGVANPVCYITSFVGRLVTGQVQFTDANGATVSAGF